MNDSKYNLTQGNILKKLLMVALPIMGTMLMQMTYNLTDMFWLGRMENSVMAVAASGIGGMFLWLGMSLMMIGRMGSEIGTSQNLGRGDIREARNFAQNSSRLALILGILYGLLLLVFAPLFVRMLQVKEASVLANATAYLRIVALGIPLTYLSASITGSFNGAGNSKLGFFANSVGLLANMILDPIMILWLGWGVAGAAIATVCAQGIVLLLFLILAKKHSHRPFPSYTVFGKIMKDKARQIFSWSLPVAVESAAFTLLAMLVTAMVSAWYGEMAVAVQRVGSQIESLSWLIGGGFASAVTAFIGQNYGARQWKRIRDGFRLAVGALFAWEVLVTVLLVFGGRFLFSIFLSDPPEILEMGGTYLKILAISQIFMGLEGAAAGTFRGLGRTLPPSICSIASNLLRPLLCWVFAQFMGMNGLWLGISISTVLRGISILIWYILREKTYLAEA